MTICRVCNHKGGFELVKAKELFIGTRTSFDYLLCPSCKSLSLASLNQDLSTIYDKYPVFNFTPTQMSSWRKVLLKEVVFKTGITSRLLLNFLQTWEDLILKSLYKMGLQKSARILDVGCGNGMLVGVLKELGFNDVTGIDPHLKELVKSEGFRMLKEEMSSLDEKFDVIMCHHSFEHFENPHFAIKEFKRLMNPGGQLLIRIPNIESYSFRKFRSSWHGIHAPFHFFLPSSIGMLKMFNDSGFEISEIRQEQIVELFLYNINLSLDVAMTEPLGIISFLGNKKLRSPPPMFSKKEINFWKQKVKAVKRDNKADYVAYYLKYK